MRRPIAPPSGDPPVPGLDTVTLDPKKAGCLVKLDLIVQAFLQEVCDTPLEASML
jgi:hypothetical protein